MKRARGTESGFTLLEVLIAAVVVVILGLGLFGALVGSFLADAGSQSTTAAVNLARQTMEEATELTFADAMALDGDTALMANGLAYRISAVQSTPSLELIEVYVSRPVPPLTVVELQGLSLDGMKQLHAAPGSQFSLVTMKRNP